MMDLAFLCCPDVPRAVLPGIEEGPRDAAGYLEGETTEVRKSSGQNQENERKIIRGAEMYMTRMTRRGAGSDTSGAAPDMSALRGGIAA
jgi:hypothetical protein